MIQFSRLFFALTLVLAIGLMPRASYAQLLSYSSLPVTVTPLPFNQFTAKPSVTAILKPVVAVNDAWVLASATCGTTSITDPPLHLHVGPVAAGQSQSVPLPGLLDKLSACVSGEVIAIDVLPFEGSGTQFVGEPVPDTRTKLYAHCTGKKGATVCSYANAHDWLSKFESQRIKVMPNP